MDNDLDDYINEINDADARRSRKRMTPEELPFKPIDQHSDAELNGVIQYCEKHYGRMFWMLLHGIDAYMERRTRHTAALVADKLRKSMEAE